MDEELRDAMQIGTWIDALRDAGAKDGENRCGALAAEIPCREEPVFAIMLSST